MLRSADSTCRLRSLKQASARQGHSHSRVMVRVAEPQCHVRNHWKCSVYTYDLETQYIKVEGATEAPTKARGWGGGSSRTSCLPAP